MCVCVCVCECVCVCVCARTCMCTCMTSIHACVNVRGKKLSKLFKFVVLNYNSFVFSVWSAYILVTYSASL